jgi:hypothetical protein
MSVVTFFSSKGAPGTTTGAMLAASLWPRPALLADCDPAGGDMGLRLPTPDGRPLDLGRGMLSLLPVARRSLDPDVLLEHAQQVLGGGEVLVGMSGPEQAAAVGPVWATIAGAFSAISSHDVIIDLGRLDSRSPVMPLAASAGLGVCVIDSSLSGVYSARARLRTLIPALQGSDGGGPRLGLVVQSRDKREAESAAAVIQTEFANITYVGHLATDASGAGIFNGRPVSRPERTLLVRSGADVIGAMQTELSRLLLDRVQPAEQPWNNLTGAYAAYAPYLARNPETSAQRTRVEERRQGQGGKFHRSRRGDNK